ncbi:Proteasome subunit alpha-type 7-like [Amphibalanus amphitrite]|uniref:Proteasome subunit alpha-type 7-like n=1 Tax=Amphibalanus amphitrite TaxID=1232801 RepID=A0A6A4WLV8_AMPAM|nr:Proteasome subunit alpha-type 7-like [Amphibalanus amphitrite]
MEASGHPTGSRDPAGPEWQPTARVRNGCDADATYTRAALLQLRAVAARPPPDAVALLRRLGLRRRCHRGRRAGRKSHRPIDVIVTTRRAHQQRLRTEAGRDERCCLSRPPRLTLRQTRRADRSRPTPAPTSQLKVAHLNVRSLTRHLDDVNHLLLTEKLDVLCLSETWLTEAMDNCTLVFPEYTVTRKDRRGRSGGGVAILHRSSLSTELLTVPSAGSALETVWIRLTGRRQIIFGAIYRPPSGPVAPVIEDLHDQLAYVVSKEKPVYILGDTNFDVNQPAKTGVREYGQLLHDFSLHQLITTPTRPGPNPSLIDHMITNRPDLVSDPRVLVSNISDHDLIAASVAGVKSRHQPRTVTIRSTRHLSQDALCLDLLQADWTPVYQAETVAAKWDAWRSAWTPLIDRHMPVRQIRTRHQPQPWLHDEDVAAAMEARDAARLDKERTPCEETEREFRIKRNAVGVRGKDVVVLGVEKKSVAKLQEDRTVRKICLIDDHVVMAFAGLTADARILISRARLECQSHRLTVEDPVTLEYITRHVATLKQSYTQSNGRRPFGISCLIGGFDYDGTPHLYQTDPSGTYHEWKANVVGRSAKSVREYLEKNYSAEAVETEKGAVKLCVCALLEVVQSGGKNLEVVLMRRGEPMKIMDVSEIEEYVTAIEKEKEEEAEKKKQK